MKKITLSQDIESPIMLNDKNSKITLLKNVHATVIDMNISRNVQFVLDENASLDYYFVQNNKDNVISQQKFLLQGENSQVKIVNLFYNIENEQSEINTSIEHVAPMTSSLLITRGIVKGKAKNIFKGIIKINKSAKDARGKQESKVLTFEEAQAYAIPELDIENNQVQCSHGSSVGQVDQEKLFYLQSRGLSEEEAESVFIKGFYEPVLNAISIPIQNTVRNEIEKRL